MIFHNGAVADVMVGDCLESLRRLPDGSAHMCVTSPPYYGLRDYGHAGQIGLEDTPDAYVARLVEVFREVRRVLTDDGTLWLNIGDSYAANRGSGNSGIGAKQATNAGANLGKLRVPVGYKEKDLIGIPWMLAFALRADGWYLRQEIIWNKPNPMPESVTDRCTKAHESVFLLSKSARYFFDHEAIKEPSVTNDTRRPYGSPGANILDPRNAQGGGAPRGRGGKNAFRGQGHFRDSDAGPANRDGREMRDIGIGEMRNKRSVWTVAPKPYAGAHFAVYPPELITPCILAGSLAGGVVLDPFGGSGTTAGVSLAHGRNAVLCELNPDYAALMPDRAKYIIDRTAA